MQAVERSTDRTAWYRRSFGRAVALTDVQSFSDRLAAFLEAGIPVVDALELSAETTDSVAMRTVIDDLRAAVLRGASFADAVAVHHRVFPSSYVAMVRAAESTGRLDQTLDRLAKSLDRDLTARRQVLGALTYPALVLMLAVIALVIMSTVVLPRFGRMYESLGADLPLPTALLLGMTDVVRTRLPLIAVTVGAAATIVVLVLGGRRGRPRRHRLLLHLPVLGRIVQLVAIERFCRTLSVLASTGVALPDAIRMASSSTGNDVFERRLEMVSESLIRGGGLSVPIAESGLFPDAARRMIEVGERTGTLGTQLSKAAAFYEREVTASIARATSLFQPAVMVAVGIAVAFIALAQVAAMYSVYGRLEI